MFIGHYGLSYIVKKKEEKLPLWLLFTSVQLLDILAFIFVLLGIEKASFAENVNPFFRNQLYLPYSHSLLGALVIASIVYLIIKYTKYKKQALLIAILVLSHWFIDLLVHVNDLPVIPGHLSLGFGLWNYPYLSYAIEIILVIVGWLLIKPRNVFSYILLALLLFMFSGMVFSHEPDVMKNNDLLRTAIVLFANGIYILFAHFSDVKQSSKV